MGGLLEMGELIQLQKPDFNVITRIDYSDENLNVPLKLWLGEIETGALEQFYNLARLPFVFKHVAAMPDAHFGYGMPIGGVLATKGYVIPNAVGMDIGCGMLCVRTNIIHIDTDTLKSIAGQIRLLVPTGFKHHEYKQSGMPSYTTKTVTESIVDSEWESAEKQLGTLGGGNHFISILKGNDNYIYVVIHSGSRNLGSKVARHYNDLAKMKNKEWCSSVPQKWDLAFLPLEHDFAKAYMNEMNFCVRFAYANRHKIMESVIEVFTNHIDAKFYTDDAINIAHNYAAIERHFRENVVVHRKGATSAYEGEIGVIPGSKGTPTYIVEGKGNLDSFKSCSHGAGRAMGREDAKRRLNIETEKNILKERGVVDDIRVNEDLEEAVSAYKDIEKVIELQGHLIEVVRKLKPMISIMG